MKKIFLFLIFLSLYSYGQNQVVDSLKPLVDFHNFANKLKKTNDVQSLEKIQNSF